MFNFDRIGWQRILIAGAGALVLSAGSLSIAAAPVQAAEICRIVPTSGAGEQLLCSHA